MTCRPASMCRRVRAALCAQALYSTLGLSPARCCVPLRLSDSAIAVKCAGRDPCNHLGGRVACRRAAYPPYPPPALPAPPPAALQVQQMEFRLVSNEDSIKACSLDFSNRIFGTAQVIQPAACQQGPKGGMAGKATSQCTNDAQLCLALCISTLFTSLCRRHLSAARHPTRRCGACLCQPCLSLRFTHSTVAGPLSKGPYQPAWSPQAKSDACMLRRRCDRRWASSAAADGEAQPGPRGKQSLIQILTACRWTSSATGRRRSMPPSAPRWQNAAPGWSSACGRLLLSWTSELGIQWRARGRVGLEAPQ